MSHPVTSTLERAAPAATAAPAMPATAPRPDFYAPIHKALRLQMCDALAALGSMDVSEADECEHALAKVDALLLQMHSHVQHENHFMHTTIEARRPGGASRTAGDHVGHLEAIANLQDELRALRHARPEQRGALALGLYRHLSAFVAENLEHMLVEERDNNAALWAHYSDAELVQMHDLLLASIAPDEMMRVLRWFSLALPVSELAFMFADMRGKLPPPAFEAALGVAREAMDAARFARLARALDLPPVPGLMTA